MNFSVTLLSSSFGPMYSSSIAVKEKIHNKNMLEGYSITENLHLFKITIKLQRRLLTYSCSRCLTNPLLIVSARHWRWLSRRPSALQSCCTLDISAWHPYRWVAPGLPVHAEDENKCKWSTFEHSLCKDERFLKAYTKCLGRIILLNT